MQRRSAATISGALSSIAASGARPVAAFVALALGPQDDLAFVEELYAGMEEVAAFHGFTIAGGDTVPLSLTITKKRSIQLAGFKRISTKGTIEFPRNA